MATSPFLSSINMACSKIFSENLFELTNEIIKYFRNDYLTLYSCILVNRLWCHLAIPLLWEDPFSVPSQNYQVIEILLVNLNENDKAHLIERGIAKNVFSPNALFNYPSFIKCLNTHNISIAVDYYATSTGKSEIYKSLFKTFIENGVNLYSFEFVLLINIDYEYFNYTLELILQNPSIIRNIRNLVIFLGRTNNILPFLEFLYSNCNSISSIHFLLTNRIPSIEKYLSKMIGLQQNLRTISFGYDCIPLYNSLLSFKDSNFSNTLNTIIFNRIDFKNIKGLNQLFNQLSVLESIHIIYCSSLDSNFIHQIINIAKSIKLKSLFLMEIMQIELFQLLLQKFGDHLENFDSGLMKNQNAELKQKLLELIVNYCINIRYLDIILFDNINIYPIFNLIGNNLKNINYLIIEFDFAELDYYGAAKLSTMILQNLGQILPSKLEYLRLDLSFNIRDLEVFLKKSQNTFIGKLSIRNIVENKGVDILPCIKKYIMKKKRVEYLAINTFFLDRNEIEDLYSLKYEVDEFKLFNINVRKYDDLYIRIYDFMNNNSDKLCKSILY